MSYQSEERYWTDYVRVATPIVGLLLLLGVFWYWANSLIGADSSAPPPTTVITVVPDDTPTPSPTTDVVIEESPPPATEVIERTNTPDDGGDPPTRTPRSEPATETPEEPATEAPKCEEKFCEGDTIVTTSDVRMRKDATTGSDIVEELAEGVELVVLDGTPVEGEGYVWWNVRDDATGNEGWVADDWLGPTGS